MISGSSLTRPLLQEHTLPNLRRSGARFWQHLLADIIPWLSVRMVRTKNGSISSSGSQLTEGRRLWARIGRRVPVFNPNQSLLQKPGESIPALCSDSIRKRMPNNEVTPTLTSTTRSLPMKRKAPLVDLSGKTLPVDIRLRASRVTQKTIDQYYVQISAFHSWAAQHRCRVTTASLDRLVVRYMTHLFEHDGAEPRVGAYLIYGLQLLKCTVPKALYLPNAKEALASWRKQKPGSMQLPVPEEIIFDVAMHIGLRRLDIFCLMMLQFDACLRPSEALNLTSEHVVHPAGPRYSRWGLILQLAELRERSKTGKSDDSVLVGDLKERRWMHKVMEYLMKNCRKKLFPGITLAQYENQLRQASEQLEYSAVVLLPHIIRHSSASNDIYHRRRDLRSVQKRGRWMARSSVSRYEKHGLLQRAWKFVAPHRKQQVQKSGKNLVSFLNTRLAV